MKTIGLWRFPEDRSELMEWDGQDYPEKHMVVRALHSRVLVVARPRIEHAWAAYLFPVPGQNHSREKHLWQGEGNKLDENVARALFPTIPLELPYAL